MHLNSRTFNSHLRLSMGHMREQSHAFSLALHTWDEALSINLQEFPLEFFNLCFPLLSSRALVFQILRKGLRMGFKTLFTHQNDLI